MPGLRHPFIPLAGVAALLAGLVACASTVSGSATYAGAGVTTTSETSSTTSESTTTSEDSSTSETSTTSESTTTNTAEEDAACSFIPLSDIGAFDQFNTLADKPEADQTQDERNMVAASFDAAAAQVQTYVDPLPQGPIRDAAQAYHDSQVQVRDGLTSGSDVTTQIILDAQDVLMAACGTA